MSDLRAELRRQWRSDQTFLKLTMPFRRWTRTTRAELEDILPPREANE